MAEKKVKNKIRVQFDFSPELLADLEELKKLQGSSSRAEAIRRAIRRDLIIAKAERLGGEMVIRKADGNETVMTLV